MDGSDSNQDQPPIAEDAGLPDGKTLSQSPWKLGPKAAGDTYFTTTLQPYNGLSSASTSGRNAASPIQATASNTDPPPPTSGRLHLGRLRRQLFCGRYFINVRRRFEIVRHSVGPASSGLCRYPSQAEAVPECDGRRCKMASMPNASLLKLSSGDEPLTLNRFEDSSTKEQLLQNRVQDNKSLNIDVVEENAECRRNHLDYHFLDFML